MVVWCGGGGVVWGAAVCVGRQGNGGTLTRRQHNVVQARASGRWRELRWVQLLRGEGKAGGLV